MSSENNLNFKCCKKVFTHYTCTICFSVYHKCCLLRNKKNIQFLTNNKIICCTYDENYSTREETSLLEKTIHDLEEESDQKNKHIQKLKYEHAIILEEALKNERDLNKLIEEQQAFINEIKQQKHELEKILTEKEVVTKSVATQTSSTISHTTSGTQTENKKHVSTKQADANTEEVSNGEQDITSVEKYCKNKHIPKILIVAGLHGKHLSCMLTRQYSEFVTEAIIKPNALDTDIVKTAIANGKYLGKHDTVIIWTSKPHIKLVDEFIEKMKHTNAIVLTKPYMYGKARNKNSGIYLDNLSFLKELYLKNINKSHVIECNSVLRESNYSSNGCYINNSGKRYLVKAIVKHIHEHFLDDKFTSNQMENNHITNQCVYPRLDEMGINEQKIAKNLAEELKEVRNQTNQDFNINDEIKTSNTEQNKCNFFGGTMKTIELT